MSTNEILDELANLSPAELRRVHDRIVELEQAPLVEETPELLAAADEGLHSLATEPLSALPLAFTSRRSL